MNVFTPQQSAGVLALFVLLSWAGIFVAWVVFTVGIPLMAFSVTRNIRGMRIELERLNATLVGGGLNMKFTVEQTGGAGGSSLPFVRAGVGPLKL